MHKWTVEDDIVTLYLYMYGDSKIGFPTKDIGEKLGMGANSLRARIGNFKAIEGDGGFAQIAALIKPSQQSSTESLCLCYRWWPF